MECGRSLVLKAPERVGTQQGIDARLRARPLQSRAAPKRSWSRWSAAEGALLAAGLAGCSISRHNSRSLHSESSGTSSSSSSSSSRKSRGNTSAKDWRSLWKVHGVACAQSIQPCIEVASKPKTMAVLGVDGPDKAAVRRKLLHGLPLEEADTSSEGFTWATKVWCSCCKGSPVSLLEAPGHVDFLPFVDIALRVSASALMVVPLGQPKAGSVPMRRPPWAELAVHWALRVEYARRPMSIVFSSSAVPLQNLGPEEIEAGFRKALQDLRLLGLRPVVLSAIQKDSDGSIACTSILEGHGKMFSVMKAELLNLMKWSKAEEPTYEEVLEFVRDHCRRLEVVPVVCILQEEEEADRVVSDDGSSVLQDLVMKVLPGVGDVVDGSEAGSWKGLDPVTGEQKLVRPLASEPFAGVAFQTTYLEKGAWKAHDMLVVRGTLRSGQVIFNATTGSDTPVRISRLEPGGGCCRSGSKVKAALPGDVVRVTLPSSQAGPGTGGLCSWCDPDVRVRLPVLHEQAYNLLAGGHSTHAVELECRTQEEEERLLGALVRSIEEDQSLRVECASAGVQLTANGSTQLRCLRTRMRRTWGVQLTLKPQRLEYGSTLKQAVEVEATVGHGEDTMTVLGRVAPSPGGQGVDGVLGDHHDLARLAASADMQEAFQRGVRRACARGLRVGNGHLPLVDVQVELLEASSARTRRGHLEPLPSQMLSAGARLIRGLVHTRLGASAHGGLASVLPPHNSEHMEEVEQIRQLLAGGLFGLMEPLVEVSVVVPPNYMHKVLGDLQRRSAAIRAVRRVRPMLVLVKARIALRRLQGYDEVLESLTRATATFTTSNCGHIEVAADDAKGIHAILHNAVDNVGSCPLSHWLQ